jgi:hypothetical protein
LQIAAPDNANAGNSIVINDGWTRSAIAASVVKNRELHRTVLDF